VNQFRAARADFMALARKAEAAGDRDAPYWYRRAGANVALMTHADPKRREAGVTVFAKNFARCKTHCPHAAAEIAEVMRQRIAYREQEAV
jgi:hypothetical protein